MSKVGIIMGSKSDLPVMQEAIDILKGFDIEVEVDIVSAHRTPEKLFDYEKALQSVCVWMGRCKRTPYKTNGSKN